MNDLTTLELEILSVLFSFYRLKTEEVRLIVDSIHVKDRIFSSPKGGECSGFYTHFKDNVALERLTDVRSEYCVQAKFDQLRSGEMGFVIFCDPARKSLLVIEGFLYGDDRVSMDELLKDEHSLSVYALPGM
ncbi:hypothetical protein LJR289_004278 [Pseudoduganella sp. LjRoot289]|uniref:hypothetical protein n=1 Tax=Pseudoduganella sp. LjRoot289 TaxID=3342314 RepID=UPI003ECFE3F6